MTSTNKKVAVVGAGVGGLAVAARLGKKGFNVEVFEKEPRCGGRCHILEDRGFKFDMGPSFVLMPDFFKEVFDYCDEDISDYLNLKNLDVHYKIFFSDGDSLSVYNDCEKTRKEIERFEPGSSKGFDGFLGYTHQIYKTVQPLLYKCFTGKSLANPSLWPVVFKLHPFASYWAVAKKFFKTDKLCYAFTFEAMFMGVSPYQAPGFYSIITYSDHIQKIAHPMGGMYKIPLALEKISKKNKVVFHYNSEVKEIGRDSKGSFIRNNGVNKYYDYIVANGDYVHAQEDLLKRKVPDYKYSCSVYLLYLGLKEKIRGLEHHNLFFSSDLPKNLEQIFNENIVPDEPSFYIHVPTVTDPTLAPDGKEIVYVLIPVANLKNKEEDIDKHKKRLRKLAFDKINKAIGRNIEDLIEVEHEFIPSDFISRYNIKNAATFGLAHNLLQSAFFRPANIDSKIKNLFYAGASTQPGGGLPVVIASSRIVADMICG